MTLDDDAARLLDLDAQTRAEVDELLAGLTGDERAAADATGRSRSSPG